MFDDEDSDDCRFESLVPHKYLQTLRPKAGTIPLEPNVVHSGYAWHQHGQPAESVWCSDRSLLEVRAGTGVVNGPMRIQARVLGPQTIHKAEIFGVWIAACLAKLRDSIVLDNRAAAWCIFEPPSLRSFASELHDAAYQLILAKPLQVHWARGHRDPKKTHSLHGYQDRTGNELADWAARTGSTMYPCRGSGNMSPTDILLNKQVMLSPAPLRAVNRDKWGPWLWGTLWWPGYGAR